jgi:hypothetical protein
MPVAKDGCTKILVLSRGTVTGSTSWSDRGGLRWAPLPGLCGDAGRQWRRDDSAHTRSEPRSHSSSALAARHRW